MSTKSREVIWGGQIMGAKMRAKGAREAARKAAREADRAEAEAWSLQMEGYGGPAQPSPTIGQCLNGGYGYPRGQMPSLRKPGEPPTRCDQASARYAGLETGGRAKMPVMPQRPLRSARAYDQVDRAAGDHAVQVDASGGGAVGLLVATILS